MPTDPLKQKVSQAVLKIVLAGIDAQVQLDAPLAPLTWYRLGGPAQALVRPGSIEALSELVRRCQDANVPVRVLGSGANLLVSDEGVAGVVVKLDHPHFACYTPIQQNQQGATCDGLRIGAGYDLFALVHQAAKHGYAGLEKIAGIPASIGGAIRMNAGGTYGEIGTYVQSVTVMDENGTITQRTKTDSQDPICFGYRSTNINQPFILEAELNLSQGDPIALKNEVKRIFSEKKNRQPMGDKSCGCVFKNPPPPPPPPPAPSTPEPTSQLTATSSQMEPQIGSKIGSKPAGMLIDQAGLKGFRIGGASVSQVHANFIVAEPGQTQANDIKKLIEHIVQSVDQAFGITLKRELVVW